MTGAVLAGGLSRRMGFNKALIKVDGETIIQRTLRLFKAPGSPFDEVFVVANDILLYEDLDVRIMADLYKGAGSLGGVFTALVHSTHTHAFVSACDMPELDISAVRAVVEAASDGFDAVVPLIGGRLHPMHGMYSRACLKPIEEMIKAGNLRITDLFDRVRTLRLDAGYFSARAVDIEHSINNINTTEDLLRTKNSTDEED